MKIRVLRKLVKYRKNGDRKRERKYARALWAVVGMADFPLNYNAVLTVFERYERLDLVPSGYLYYEFFRV